MNLMPFHLPNQVSFNSDTGNLQKNSDFVQLLKFWGHLKGVLRERLFRECSWFERRESKHTKTLNPTEEKVADAIVGA